MTAEMTPDERAAWKAKMRSIGSISRRTGPAVTEGRSHPESGKPYKTVTDEHGHQVTEHGTPGSGLSDRQDVTINAPTITADLRELR